MLEVRERCEAALSPLWDAVKLLQAGVRDGAGALAGVQQDLGVLQQAQVGCAGLVGLIVSYSSSRTGETF